MALSLYQEAIAEAKQLRDVAEQNAKNKIIDAVTPKIRRLIERQLLGEDHEPGHDEEEDELGGGELFDLSDEEGEEVGVDTDLDIGLDVPTGPEGSDDMTMIDLDDLGSEEAFGAGLSVGAEPEVQADMGFEEDPGMGLGFEPDVAAVDLGDAPSVDVHVAQGDLNVDDLTISSEVDNEEEDELLLDEPVAEALSRMLKHRKHQKKQTLHLEQKLGRFQRKLQRFYALVEALKGKHLTTPQRAIVRNHYTKLLREIGSLRRAAILTERESGDSRLNRRTVSILKEMNKMAKTSRRRNTRGNYITRLLETQVETDLAEFDLFEEEEDEAADEEVVDLEAEEGAEGEADVDVGAAQGALEDLGAALGLDVTVEEEGEGEEEEEDLEDEEGEEGGDELEFEGDLYAGHFREGDDEDEKKDELDEDDVVMEIDETMLRRELRRMKRLREETSGVDEPAQTADAFGGGDVEDEMFVDVDEKTLLNALADELGDVKSPAVSGGAGNTDAMTAEGRRRRARSRVRNTRSNNRTNESRRNRALTGKLGDYKKAVGSLRGQLTEMNLFNAKLLYANKLMQNRSLSGKAQRAIVEALDSAKTLREAKLLYKSLTNSLGKSRTRTSLRENAVRRTSGSSSRSTQSASPANSGVEVDRWAVLAGINGKDN